MSSFRGYSEDFDADDGRGSSLTVPSWMINLRTRVFSNKSGNPTETPVRTSLAPPSPNLEAEEAPEEESRDRSDSAVRDRAQSVTEDSPTTLVAHHHDVGISVPRTPELPLDRRKGGLFSRLAGALRRDPSAADRKYARALRSEARKLQTAAEATVRKRDAFHEESRLRSRELRQWGLDNLVPVYRQYCAAAAGAEHAHFASLSAQIEALVDRAATAEASAAALAATAGPAASAAAIDRPPPKTLAAGVEATTGLRALCAQARGAVRIAQRRLQSSRDVVRPRPRAAYRAAARIALTEAETVWRRRHVRAVREREWALSRRDRQRSSELHVRACLARRLVDPTGSSAAAFPAHFLWPKECGTLRRVGRGRYGAAKQASPRSQATGAAAGVGVGVGTGAGAGAGDSRRLSSRSSSGDADRRWSLALTDSETAPELDAWGVWGPERLLDRVAALVLDERRAPGRLVAEWCRRLLRRLPASTDSGSASAKRARQRRESSASRRQAPDARLPPPATLLSFVQYATELVRVDVGIAPSSPLAVSLALIMERLLFERVRRATGAYNRDAVARKDASWWTRSQRVRASLSVWDLGVDEAITGPRPDSAALARAGPGRAPADAQAEAAPVSPADPKPEMPPPRRAPGQPPRVAAAKPVPSHDPGAPIPEQEPGTPPQTNEARKHCRRIARMARGDGLFPLASAELACLAVASSPVQIARHLMRSIRLLRAEASRRATETAAAHERKAERLSMDAETLFPCLLHAVLCADVYNIHAALCSLEQFALPFLRHFESNVVPPVVEAQIQRLRATKSSAAPPENDTDPAGDDAQRGTPEIPSTGRARGASARLQTSEWTPQRLEAIAQGTAVAGPETEAEWHSLADSAHEIEYYVTSLEAAVAWVMENGLDAGDSGLPETALDLGPKEEGAGRGSDSGNDAVLWDPTLLPTVAPRDREAEERAMVDLQKWVDQQRLVNNLISTLAL